LVGDEASSLSSCFVVILCMVSMLFILLFVVFVALKRYLCMALDGAFQRPSTHHRFKP